MPSFAGCHSHLSHVTDLKRPLVKSCTWHLGSWWCCFLEQVCAVFESWKHKTLHSSRFKFTNLSVHFISSRSKSSLKFITRKALVWTLPLSAHGAHGAHSAMHDRTSRTAHRKQKKHYLYAISPCWLLNDYTVVAPIKGSFSSIEGTPPDFCWCLTQRIVNGLKRRDCQAKCWVSSHSHWPIPCLPSSLCPDQRGMKGWNFHLGVIGKLGQHFFLSTKLKKPWLYQLQTHMNLELWRKFPLLAVTYITSDLKPEKTR